MSDNWIHRSRKMKCDTCMWFIEKSKSGPQPATTKHETETEPVARLGRCRRHAPTMSGFPAVFGSDWCGDHKLDENRV
jgi:hypothetical protein